MHVRCASCQNIFEPPAVTGGFFTCPACGATLRDAAAPPPVATELSPATFPATPSEPSSTEPTPTPWENRRTRGFFTGYWETFVASIKAPDRFFENQPRDNARGALSYYCLSRVAPLVIWLPLMLLFLVPMFALLPSMGHELDGALPVAFAIGGAIVLAAIGIPISLFVIAGVMHLSAWIFGGKGTFSDTLRIAGYSSGPSIFQAVPILGDLAALGYQAVLWVYGLMHLHRMKGERAVLALVIPAVLGCCCLLSLSFLSSFLGQLQR